MIESIPCLSLLRHPCTADDVVEATKALLGSPWPDDNK